MSTSGLPTVQFKTVKDLFEKINSVEGDVLVVKGLVDLPIVVIC
jgi:hypothetical protein